MKIPLVLLLATLTLAGCRAEEEAKALQAKVSKEQVWTFIHFNVPEEDEGMESYYYFGQIPKSIYQLISTNSLESGFVHVQNMHYWGNDDLIYSYRDQQNNGDMIFRIEDIQTIKLVRKAPVVGRGYEQFEEPKNQGIMPASGEDKSS